MEELKLAEEAPVPVMPLEAGGREMPDSCRLCNTSSTVVVCFTPTYIWFELL
jgi:hypothetical protein